MIRTCSVVIISQKELFKLREQIYHAFLISNNIVLLRDVFHIGLVIGPRPAVLA